MDRICRWCRVRFPSSAVFFALFGQFYFFAPLLSELFLCFPFLLMHVFCIIISFIGGYELPFALKKAFFGSFCLFGLKQA
jgi:hypothetical protein